MCPCVLPWVLSPDTGEGAAGPGGARWYHVADPSPSAARAAQWERGAAAAIPFWDEILQSSWVSSSEKEVASLLLSVRVC